MTDGGGEGAGGATSGFGSASRSSSGASPGALVGPGWVVTRRVARGPHGVLLQCRDEARGELLAVKLMRAESPTRARRFHREVELLEQLDHPHVVRHRGHGETADGHLFLAMEWIDGPDLAAHLATTRPTAEQAVAAALGVARALAAAHQRRIVHRDVKPANLMLPGGDYTAIKVLDFGIARALEHSRLTSTGSALGTAGYMAPEQLTAIEPVGPPADVFALGCVLFEMLTGTPAVVVHPGGSVTPQRLRHHAPHLAAALDAVLASFMAEAPTARPADGAAALAMLLALPERLLVAAPAVVTSPVRPPTASRRVASAVLAPGLDASAATLRTFAAAAPGLAVRELPGGGVALVASGEGGASDAASQAVDAALALRARDPGLALGVASALVPHVDEVPAEVPGLAEGASLATADAPPTSVAVSPLTARLLSGHHAVTAAAGRLLATAQPRWRPRSGAPCVGRERELRLVVSEAQAAAEEGIVRCLVVTGPPGSGKSRLLHEGAARCAASGVRVVVGGHSPPEPEVFDAEGPVALFIDVGQGRGAGCLERVEQCFPRAHDRGLLVVIGVRGGLDELPPAVAGRPGLSLTRLGPLSRAAGLRLAEGLVGPGPRAAALAEQAHGLPFVAEELAHAGAPSTAFPLAALAMAQHELDGLPLLAASLLAALSVFPEAVPGGAAAALTGLPEASASALVGLLLARGALAPPPSGDGLAVRDELLRQAARAALTPGERTRLHQLAAGFLESLGPAQGAAAAAQREAAVAPHP